MHFDDSRACGFDRKRIGFRLIPKHVMPAPRSPVCKARRCAVGAALLVLFVSPGFAVDTPPHLLRYLEGLDSLSSGKWAEAATIFDEVSRNAGRDGRPAMSRGVALTMQGRYQDAVTSFQQARNLGYGGREPVLWTYIIGRMANQSFVPGQGIQGPQSLGGGTFFSGVPGHMLQGGDDYPTDYASFLYYVMATPIGTALENGRSADTPRIREKMLEGARWYANRARAANDLVVPLYKRAEVLDGNGQFKEALEMIAIVRVPFPDDWLTAALASDCWVGLGRPATARRESTLALIGAPENAYSLMRRSFAGGKLGRSEQARADLKYALSIDEDAVESSRAAIENSIKEGERSGDVSALRRELVKLAANKASAAQIDEVARSLAFAVERSRLYYDEYYATRLRQWVALNRKSPKDPGPIAALAAAIIDEARSDRRGEALEPGRAITPYRVAVDDKRDLRRALAFADQALGIDAKNVGALMQRARALSRLGDNASAEKIIAHALTLAPKDPQALRLQGQFWIDRANQLLVAASLARSPRISSSTWTENRSDGVWEVTRTTTTPPSQSDLTRAAQYEAEARRLLSSARTAIDAALKATRGTLEGDLLLADVALSENRWADADNAARAALKRDPKSLAAYDIIVDAHRLSGQRDRADDACSERANVVHTTAGWKLLRAWRVIEARQLDAAKRLLDEAEKLDPADGRVDALRGEIARLSGRHDDARTSWRVALALAEARVAMDDQPAAAPKPPMSRNPLEFGLAMAMRERLASTASPSEALALFQSNAAYGASLPPGGAGTEMFTAMLPDPEAPAIPVRRPRSMADCLVMAHVGAAGVLAASNRSADAIAEYLAASRYAAPGGNDMIPNIGDKKGNRQNSNFAVYATCPELGEALIVLGSDAVGRRDYGAAQVYLQQAVAAPISREQRQKVNELQMQIARAYRGR